LTFVAIVSLFPLYWLFNTALTPATSTVKLPPDLIPVAAQQLCRDRQEERLRLFNPDQFIRMPRLTSGSSAAFITFQHGRYVLFDSMAGYALPRKALARTCSFDDFAATIQAGDAAVI
jgi:multiple sugar transport system permease protein